MQTLKHLTKLWALFVLAVLLAFPVTSQAQYEKLVVRAVMFWMDTCGHCHYIMDNVLPPLQEKYGNQLEILLIELDSIEAANLLYDTAEAYGIPRNSVGVPLLFIGEKALSGSQQIPAELPDLIEQHLAAGGIDYPEITGLEAYLPDRTEQDADDELCKLSAPCPSEAEEASYPPPIALPAVSSAGSTGSYPPPSTPLPYVPPAEKVETGAKPVAEEAVPTPPDSQVVFQPGDAPAEREPASQNGIPFLSAAVGFAFVLTAFVLYNVLNSRQKNNPHR